MTITTPNRWVTIPRPNPQAKLRLFCFPYAGSSASVYRPWVLTLPEPIEVCLIELPGRGMRMNEAALTDLSEIVRAIAIALQPYFDKPFACFGHSMGALISFELARRLRQDQHCQPLHLIVSGRQAPQVPDTKPPLHNSTDSELRDTLRRFNGTPAEILDNSDLMQLLLPVLRADFKALENYRYVPAAPLQCPITAIGGLHDPEVDVETLEAWREQTAAAFSLQVFPGDHFFLHHEQSALVKTLTDQLSSFF